VGKTRSEIAREEGSPSVAVVHGGRGANPIRGLPTRKVAKFAAYLPESDRQTTGRVTFKQPVAFVGPL
jgi:hypothetical protein